MVNESELWSFPGFPNDDDNDDDNDDNHGNNSNANASKVFFKRL